MTRQLLIVESGGKIKKLQEILGPGWIIKASGGHIRELASDGKNALGFEFNQRCIHCRFVLRGDRAAATLEQLKTLVKRVDKVVLATDDDREGETIAWHLQQTLSLCNPERIVYSEITAAALNSAIANPRPIDLNRVDAGICRSVLDKLVGYTGSPVLWQLQIGAASLGRVQSTTLHILCERERQIQNFVPQDYWSIFVDYEEGFRAFYRKSAAQSPIDETQNEQADESERITTQAEAEAIVHTARQFPHSVVSVDGKIVHRSPHPPLLLRRFNKQPEQS